MQEESPGVTKRSLPPLTAGPYRKRLGRVALIATLGGLLFGYDTSVINGAGMFMARPDQLNLDDVGLGIAVSSLLFAAALGAMTGGRLSDAWGRRKTIIVLSILFFVGVGFVVTAAGLIGVVIGRIMLGLAVGAASTVVPVYLAELAPFEIRGSLAGRNEAMIVTGQLVAIVINAIIGNTWGESHPGVWRVMFMFAALPAIALFIGMLRMPESPRWLVDKGRKDEAIKILDAIRPENRARLEVEEIIETRALEVTREKMNVREIFSNKNLIRIVLIGCGLGFFQQMAGINSILYYGADVLRNAGFGEGGALIANIAPATINVIAAIVALQMMDHFSRRKTFLWGYGLMTVSHLAIGAAAQLLPDGNTIKPFVLLFLIVFFVGANGLLLNVATWVTLSEIFPQRMRAFGMGMSVFVLWITNATLGLIFPSLITAVGIAGSFFTFAAFTTVAFLFVAKWVPETRGRTLEELEQGVLTGSLFKRSKAS